MSRSKRRVIAKETLEILERGHYTSRSGNLVDLQKAQKRAVENSKLYRPDGLPDLLGEAEAMLNDRSGMAPAVLEIREATTFYASRELEAEGCTGIACLNFASAKNPGGGFLGGSQAQEEALARASGLYPCLSANFDYYLSNRKLGGAVYSHHLIYAPEVPVIRDDNDELLDQLHTVSVLTSPAVNVGALPKQRRTNKAMIREVMLERTEQVLAVCLVYGHKTLVMGAWGCGVFRNDPKDVASYFLHFLEPGGKYAHAFDRVVFAIPGFSSSLGNLKAFREVFAEKNLG